MTLTKEQLLEMRGNFEYEGMHKVVAAIDMALSSLSAEPVAGEVKLAQAGVFAGHHGLRGLAEADKFWEQQPYGTRLYYGGGIGEYLHRGVLQTAVEILDGSAPLAPPDQSALREQNARLVEAYEKGWIQAARWANEEHLISDIDSPAYIADRDAALKEAK